MYSKNPSFPEHIIARGLQVFSTTVCNRQKENDIIKYGEFQCSCPCCMYPAKLQPPSTRLIKSNIRCVECGKIINTDIIGKQYFYYVENRGFMDYFCALEIPEDKKRRMVVLW